LYQNKNSEGEGYFDRDFQSDYEHINIDKLKKNLDHNNQLFLSFFESHIRL